MDPVATWTRHHHEHYDGTGYPFGLSGTDIPIGSRIILVADAFESMTSDRIYRRALGQAQAVHELRSGAGRQFDPQVVETMVALIEQGVFVQVMQQYGRVIEPASVDQAGLVRELDPAAAQATATAAALDGNPPTAHATSEAEAWALQQITDEHWANPGQTPASTAAPAAPTFAAPAVQPAANEPAAAEPSQAQWTQDQWEAYQMQAAQEQAAFDAQQAHQAQLAQLAAQQAHAQEAAAVPDPPSFDPSAWAAPNPDDLAA
jgi:hypothetical protein